MVPFEVEGPSVAHSASLHHPSASLVDGHGLRCHARCAKSREGDVDEGLGSLGSQTLPPPPPSDAVADVVGGVVARHEAKPPDELIASAVEGDPPRPKVLSNGPFNLLTGTRSASEESHDLGVAVEFNEQVDVARRHRSQ